MLGWSNTTATGASSSILLQPLTVAGTTGAVVLWSPTAQDLTDGTSALGTVAEQAQRTATTCFMRGLSERVRIQTSSGLPFFWRRICFCSRSLVFQQAATSDSPTNGVQPYLDTSQGIQRYALNQTINVNPATLANQQAIIFKGQAGVDWTDTITAPVDTNRVSLKSDKTYTIRSGNANGTVRELKNWYPMNKNVVYDDDENGSGESTSYFSVTDNRGMGNFYIYDIIQAGYGASSSDFLSATFTDTLYWHER